MKNIKKYQEFTNESIEPVDYVDITIDDKFEEEISMMEFIDISNKSIAKRFDDKELLKLNLVFKEYKVVDKSAPYYFKLHYGGFGTPRTKLLGNIEKRIEFNDLNTFYIMDFIMTVTVGSSKGMKEFRLKFDNIEDIGKFFKSFQN